MSIEPHIMVHPRPALAPSAGSATGSGAGKSTPVPSQPRPEQAVEPAWMREQMATGEADAHGFRHPNGENQDLGFFDFLDVINPLQHLPIIGGIYRQLTGDQMAPAAHAAGVFLWGGPLSLLAGVMNGAMEEDTGKDMMGTMVAWLEGDSPADLPPGSVVDTGAGGAAALAATDQTGAQTGTQTANSAAAPGNADANGVQTVFQGAAASRLDAFIRANGNAQNTGPSGVSAASMDAMAIRQSLRLDIDTADLRDARKARAGSQDAGSLANRTPVSGPATAPGSVGSWMTQALDQYDTLKAVPPTGATVGSS